MHPSVFFRRQLAAALAFVCLLPLPLAAQTTPGRTAPSAPVFTPCRLAHPLKINAIEAECTTVRVREGDAADGRMIDLAIARVPAISSTKKSDPIVLLAGGPGMGAQLMYATSPAAFARARRNRDIVLIDQRGTGKSTPLVCAGGADDPLLAAETSDSIAQFLALTAECRDALSKTHDLRAFTTSRAVRDLEEIRARLGYEALNIYGVSYGSRVALHYARRYPTRVRSLILDGVVAPQGVLGPRIALDAQSALDGLFARCRKDPACAKAFGDPGKTLREVQATLQRSPATVRLPHPLTGEEISLTLGAAHLATVVRLASYEPQLASMLPLVLHQTSRADYRPLASLFLITVSGISESLAAGMHNTVVCSEDYPRFGEAAVDRRALEASYIGPTLLEALGAVCKDWPRGTVDRNFSEALQSDIPSLLLSGTLDPVTPSTGADRVAKTLRNSRHIVIKDSGHGQIGLPCIDRVFRDFFEAADPKSLDASCLERWVAPPFWTSSAGPPP